MIVIQILEELREEIAFDCWCNTVLITTRDSVLKHFELETDSATKKINTHLLRTLLLQFYSNTN